MYFLTRKYSLYRLRQSISNFRNNMSRGVLAISSNFKSGEILQNIILFCTFYLSENKKK